MVLPVGLRCLDGWKYSVYIGDKIAKWPGLVETSVEHGVPRQTIRIAEYGFTNLSVFDFYMRLQFKY
jgi:hypothetical protein